MPTPPSASAAHLDVQAHRPAPVKPSSPSFAVQPPCRQQRRPPPQSSLAVQPSPARLGVVLCPLSAVGCCWLLLGTSAKVVVVGDKLPQATLKAFVEKADELKAKGVDVSVCTSVNDAFVMLLSDGNGELVVWSPLASPWLILCLLFICLFFRCCVVMSYFLVYVVSDPGSPLFRDFVGCLFSFCCFCLDQCCSDPNSFRILMSVRCVWVENLASADLRRPWQSAELTLSCPLDFVLSLIADSHFGRTPPRSMTFVSVRSPFAPLLCHLALVGSASISVWYACTLYAVILLYI